MTARREENVQRLVTLHRALPPFPSGQWLSDNLSSLCRSRGVERSVADFITHNMSYKAAEAALRAMPVVS